ncbi:MAG: threonine/serine dehydratase [Rhodospirillales bacterium]
MTERPTIDDIDDAAERIKERVRRTPCLRTRFIREPLHGGPLMLKLECLQVTGSFKPRGANNAILQLDDGALERGVITASGGNHGLAVAYAAHASGRRAVVYLPERAPASKAEKLKAWGADVVIEGLDFDDAYAACLTRAERDGMTFIHPFNDPAVIAGQGTVGREMMKQSPDIDVVLVAIGGGGLISGIATSVKAAKPDALVIGVEAEGAPTLRASRDAGELVTLEKIDTQANTLAPKRSAELNFEIIEDLVDDIVTVSDEAMRDAARWLWFEMGIAAEMSGAAALAALKTGAVSYPEDVTLAAVVCGAGTDGIG